jgi:hypothetical protein
MDPPSEIPPTGFLKELVIEGKVHVAIGFPENDVIPTLSLPDFVRLSKSRSLYWKNIHECLMKKYGDRVENKEASAVASQFLKDLSENVGNPKRNKNILLYPGRWNTFIPQVAHTLAQNILNATNFGVYIATQVHPLSDQHNVRELNPTIFRQLHSVQSL